MGLYLANCMAKGMRWKKVCPACPRSSYSYSRTQKTESKTKSRLIHQIILTITSERGAWRPAELLPAQEVHMQVEDSLSGMLSIIDDDPVALLEAFLLGDLRGRYHQFPQNCLVPFFGLGKPGQSVFVFGDDEDVGGCDWCNVPEGEHELVFVDNFRRNFLANQFVEDCLFGHCGPYY